MPFKAPPKFPIAVRAAPTMTAVLMVALPALHYLGGKVTRSA
jgi:hypothetical protein